jgi:hypothetical protein
VKRLAVFYLALLLLVPSAGAYEVELPGEGNVFNSIPFDKFWGDTRYQQIYDNSIFPPEGGYISQISFIPNSQGEYGASVEISLSHTTILPGELSIDLDSNVTETPQVVRSNPAFYQVLTIDPQDPDNPVVTNTDYGLNFNLDVPFLYNPAEGNLLLDVRISNQSRSLSALKAVMSAPYLSERVYVSQYGPGEKEVPPVGMFTLFDMTDSPAPVEPPPPQPEPELEPVPPSVEPPPPVERTPTDNTPVYPPPVHSGTTLVVGCSTTGGNSDTGLLYLFVLLPLVIRWCGRKYMGAS